MSLRKQDTAARSALLDPRAPLVVDTRELGRRPGSMRRVSRTAPAPADLANAVMHVAVGEPMELELRLEAVMEGVLVSGTVRTRATGECVRCLDPLQQDIEVGLQELYAYPSLDRDWDPDEEDEFHRLEGDLLDLEPALRDAVVLALPLQPVCSESCPGLCPECGARLADDPDHAHESVDSRWAALTRLLPASDAERLPAGPESRPPHHPESHPRQHPEHQES